MICQSVVVTVASHVCKSGPFAPVIPLFHCHGCRSVPSAPVGFNECCPELRQEPAQLRVHRNSPRAMPLFGLPIIVMTALYTSRKQGKLQRACAYGGPEMHGCRSGTFAPVVPLFHCHGCRSWVFAPVVGFTCADQAFSYTSLDSRVQIVGFCPRRLSWMLSLTAARDCLAQGASQFAAGHAAVRL